MLTVIMTAKERKQTSARFQMAFKQDSVIGRGSTERVDAGNKGVIVRGVLTLERFYVATLRCSLIRI